MNNLRVLARCNDKVAINPEFWCPCKLLLMANRVGFERRPERPGLTGNRAFARGS